MNSLISENLDLSWYITIRGSADYSIFVESAALIAYLSSHQDLQQAKNHGFESAAGKPWVQIVIASCNAAGSYAVEETCPQLINVIELICSESEDLSWYESLATEVAKLLGWSAYMDHDDRKIWPR